MNPYNANGMLNHVPISNPAIVNGLLPLIPLPNISRQYLDSTRRHLPTHWRQELFKIDQNVTDKVRANFRYIHDSWDQQYPVPLWTSGTSFPTVQTAFTNPGVSMVARLTATVSPTLLNEFVASYTTDHIGTHLTGPWQRGNIPDAWGFTTMGFGGKVPGISLSGGEFQGGFSEDPGYVPEWSFEFQPHFYLPGQRDQNCRFS